MKVGTLGMRVLGKNTSRLFPMSRRLSAQTTDRTALLCLAGLGERGSVASVTPRRTKFSKLIAGLRFSVAGPGGGWSSLARWAMAAGGELVAVGGRHPGEPSVGGGTSPGGAGGSRDGGPGPAADRRGGRLDRRDGDGARRPAAGAGGAPHLGEPEEPSALALLRAAGSSTGSLHPLKAFPQAKPDPAEGRSVFFAVDGDPEARELAFRLARAFGGVAAEVPAAARPLYHFAATLAAGGVVTLLAAAAEIAGGLGLPGAVTRGYLELARGSLPSRRPDARRRAGRSPKPSPVRWPATTARPSAVTSPPSRAWPRGSCLWRFFYSRRRCTRRGGRRRSRADRRPFDSRRLL